MGRMDRKSAGTPGRPRARNDDQVVPRLPVPSQTGTARVAADGLDERIRRLHPCGGGKTGMRRLSGP